MALCLDRRTDRGGGGFALIIPACSQQHETKARRLKIQSSDAGSPGVGDGETYCRHLRFSSTFAASPLSHFRPSSFRPPSFKTPTLPPRLPHPHHTLSFSAITIIQSAPKPTPTPTPTQNSKPSSTWRLLVSYVQLKLFFLQHCIFIIISPPRRNPENQQYGHQSTSFAIRRPCSECRAAELWRQRQIQWSPGSSSCQYASPG